VIVPPDFRRKFPLLVPGTFHQASPATTAYNCIAWAAGVHTVPWWPHQDAFWPPGVPIEDTIDAVVRAFATLGYGLCADGVPETDFEKIAIYADFGGTPAHAARQLPDGMWTSKLGPNIDIVHTEPRVLNGPEYGTVVRFMRRRQASLSNIAR
jgi:hypothetical protein